MTANKDKNKTIPQSELWIPAVEFWKDDLRLKQFHKLVGGLPYDPLRQGYFFTRNSRSHTAAILLGFRIYDPNLA